MIEIIITPAKDGRYTASLDERELVTAKEPLFAGARKLIAEGVHPDTTLAMRHAGSKTQSMLIACGTAARLTVWEPDSGLRFEVARWKASNFAAE